MVYVDTFPNMKLQIATSNKPWKDKIDGIFAVYGSPASIDKRIMSARVEVPRKLTEAGYRVDVRGVETDWIKTSGCYKGSIPSYNIGDILVDYKYYLCFENSYNPLWSWDWITERIYNAFLCRSVPIYWGCYNIEERIPTRFYIDFRKCVDKPDVAKALLREMENHAETVDEAYEWAKEKDLNSWIETYESLKRE
jgi:hypothetical protein